MAINGCAVIFNSTKSYTTTTATASWDSELYDTNNYWTISDPTKLIVPSGVSRVRVGGIIQFSATVGGTGCGAFIKKDNSFDFIGGTGQTLSVGYSDPRISFISPYMTVVPGTYFELEIRTVSDTAYDVLTTSVFYIEEAPAAFSGATLQLSSDVVIPSGSLEIFSWSTTPVYNIGGWFNSGTPTRLIVPPGVSKVRLGCFLEVLAASISTDISNMYITILKNNTSSYIGAAGNIIRLGWDSVNGKNAAFSVISPVFDVSSGDYFEVQIQHNDTGGLTFASNKSTFFIEKIA